MDGRKCAEHSGCMARIDNLEKDNEAMAKKVDKIFNRINLILGGIVVSCIMLAINLAT